MKPIRTLLAVALLQLGFQVVAQPAPDFNGIKDYQRRMDSLKAYCNMLLGSDSAKGDNFPMALIYGLKGLGMSKKEDHRSRAQFAMVAGGPLS